MLTGILGLHPVTGASAASAASGAPLIFGTTTGTGNSGGQFADLSIGEVYESPATGTIDTLHVKGHPTISRTGNYRLVIYSATNSNTPVTKLGETAATTGVAAATTANLSLLVPVSVTAGNLYWIGMHTGSGFPGCAGETNVVQNLVFNDTFADGAAGTAGATSAHSFGHLVIWATGTTA